MKRTSVFLTEQQIKALAAMSKSTGLPVSEYIRRAVDDLLKKQHRAKQGVISSEHSAEDLSGK
jgi:Arc/MetJ-type ribon-helix-helix transcriptional regulator